MFSTNESMRGRMLKCHLTDVNQFLRALPDNLDAKVAFACRIGHHLQ
jgi:hypothetical protein